MRFFAFCFLATVLWFHFWPSESPAAEGKLSEWEGAGKGNESTFSEFKAGVDKFLKGLKPKPAVKEAEGVAARLGERRAGVVIALDASYSMQHGDGTSTRFERAIEKVDEIVEGLVPGSPISLILLGDEHEVVLRNMAYDPARFAGILHALKAGPCRTGRPSRHATDGLVGDTAGWHAGLYVRRPAGRIAGCRTWPQLRPRHNPHRSTGCI